MSPVVLDYSGTDRDRGVHVAVPPDIADGTGIDAPPMRFEFLDDLQGTDFRSAGQRAGRECRAQYIDGIQFFLDLAGHVRNDMHDMGIPLDCHHVCHRHAAGHGNPSDVVSPEVDQHQVFGELFRVGQQFLGQIGIFLSGLAPVACPGDRPQGDHPVFEPDQDFRGRSGDVEIAEIEVVHVGGGVEGAQCPVQVDRPARVVKGKPL